MTCEQVFLEQLHARGFRLTPQREMILTAMHEIEGAATAEEIHQRVMTVSACVDISTVYRTLDLLREFHLVASIDASDGQHRYTLVDLDEPHLHLACQSCGTLISVEVKEAYSLLEHLRHSCGFEADLASTTIPGLCANCRTRAIRARGVSSGSAPCG
jgi:Fur family ferric uptake transcriptional regulator